MCHRILLIEDDINYGSLLKWILESGGHYVDVAENGADGLAKWKGSEYNVVIVDHWLMGPGADGISTIRAARTVGLSTGVLLLTALMPYEVEKRVEGLDVYAICEKNDIDSTRFRQLLEEAADFTQDMQRPCEVAS